MFLAQSGSEQGIMGYPCITYARKCERNLDDGSWEITIEAVDGLEQLMFVATCPGDKRDRFARTSGNLYVLLKEGGLGSIGPDFMNERG